MEGVDKRSVPLSISADATETAATKAGAVEALATEAGATEVVATKTTRVAASSQLPTVTVLIDTYNYGRFVGRAIDSALHQDYPSELVEVLVVDDGSTDDTPQVVRDRYGDSVRYIRKANGGQASALNLGFREASGDFICILDADDYFFPDKVRVVVDAFLGRPEAGLVYDEFDFVDEELRSLGKTIPEPTWTGYRLAPARIEAQLRSLILLGHPWSCVLSSMTVRRSVVANLIIPERAFPRHPDVFLYLVLPFMTPVSVVESPHSAYVYHGDNMQLFRSSPGNLETQLREMVCARQYIEERFGVRFLTYLGRSIYGHETGVGARGVRRFATYGREARQIASADVGREIKRASQAKLAASLVLPDPLYSGLRALRASARRRLPRKGRSSRQ
jgi:glycosyltransferase involved in cell wall biosynthesis